MIIVVVIIVVVKTHDLYPSHLRRKTCALNHDIPVTAVLIQALDEFFGKKGRKLVMMTTAAGSVCNQSNKQTTITLI
jgi:hypothetical protein